MKNEVTSMASLPQRNPSDDFVHADDDYPGSTVDALLVRGRVEEA